MKSASRGGQYVSGVTHGPSTLLKFTEALGLFLRKGDWEKLSSVTPEGVKMRFYPVLKLNADIFLPSQVCFPWSFVDVLKILNNFLSPSAH